MKRFVSSLLCACILLSFAPSVLASGGIEHVFVYDDHGDNYTGKRGDWVRQSSDQQNEVVEKTNLDGEDVLELSRTAAGSSSVLLMTPQVTMQDCESLVLQFKMRAEDLSIKSIGTADEGPNPDWHFLTLFTTDDEGFINVGGKAVCFLPLNEFHELTFIVNNLFHTCKFYYDGQYKTEFAIDKLYKHLNELSINMTSAAASTCYIDDFAMYEAEERHEIADVKARYDEIRSTAITLSPTRSELEANQRGFHMFAVDAKYASDGEKRIELSSPLVKLDNGNIMLPIRAVGESFGAEVTYEENGTITLVRRCLTLIYHIGSDIMNERGEDKTVKEAAVLRNGTAYVSADEFFRCFGKVFYDSEYGFYAIGTTDYAQFLDDYITAKEMYYFLVYYKPTSAEILESYQSTSANVHPRLKYTRESVAKLLEQAKTDPDTKIWYDKQIADANALFDLPAWDVIRYNGELNTSFTANTGVFSTLAQAYLFTGDRRYADEMWRHMKSFLNNVEDLNHRRAYLNGSGAASEIAKAYDWAYDYFTQEQRDAIAAKLKNLAVDPWMRAFQGLGSFGSQGYANYATDNINCVTHAQLMNAVVPIFDTDPVYYAKFTEAVYRQIEYYLPNYAPDGGYYEGPFYWQYATTNLVSLYEALESLMGGEYNYYDVFNISTTGAFPLYMSGDTLGFNFSDGERASLIAGAEVSYYFAKRNNDPDFAAVVLNIMKANGIAIGSRWYDPDFASNEIPEYPLDKYFRVVESGSMRERWADTGAAYLGYRGGTNSGGHEQLDKGQFVFDSKGERWAEDLGRDNYNYPGYFDTNSRYLYYMNRAEGHNVLLVNPKGRYADQTLDATSYRLKSESGKGSAYVVMETTPVYDESDVSAAKRGFMLADSRQTAVIRDELTLKKNNSDIWWFMHTRADVNILEGGKKAILSIGGKQCLATLDCSNPDAVFSVQEPVAFTESPHPEAQYITEIRNTRKLTVNTTGNKGDFYIAVNLRGVDYDAMAEFKYLNKFDAIDSWAVSDVTKNVNALTSLSLDGQPIEGFLNFNTSYEVSIEDGTIPKVSATTKKGYSAEVEQATTLPGVAAVKVTSNTNEDDRYTVRVNFKVPLKEGIPDGYEETTIASYEASPQNVGKADGEAKNIFDGDVTTRWAAEGNSEVIIDLGEKKKFDGISTAFYLGNERVNFFTIDTSDDKVIWKNIFDGESTGKTEDYMTVLCEGTQARYIRLSFMGTSTGTWNSLLELRVINKK